MIFFWKKYLVKVMSYNPNATEIAYNFICSKIRNNDWNAGEKIWTEKELIQQLGVSRIAIRQAVDRLSGEGILKKIQGSGTYVCEESSSIRISYPLLYSLSGKDMLDFLRFRSYFEAGNVEWFIRNADPDEFKKLHKIQKELEEHSFSQKDVYKYDVDFHRVIAIGTKNNLIINLFNSLTEAFEQYQEKLYRTLGAGNALKFHPLIMDYIDKRDIPAATMMMSRHMNVVAEILEEYVKDHPDEA